MKSSPIRHIELHISKEQLCDLLHVYWNSVKVIRDDETALIQLDLPETIRGVLKLKKRKEGRLRYHKLNE